MYHHVSASESKGLVISVAVLDAQFAWLKDQGYTSWHLSELNEINELPEGKHVVITFDDAYVSFIEKACPLLQKHRLKATLFVPLGYIGKTDAWNTATLEIMSASQLSGMDSTVVELAYHSFAHGKLNEMSLKEIEYDNERCFETVKAHNLSLFPAVAYPYGKYPRNEPQKTAFQNLLKKENFQYGLRIGNRLNTFPFTNPFEIQRLDIKGEYSLAKFRRKVRFGRLF